MPWPVGPIPLARYQRLPFESEIAEMTAAAAAFYGLPGNAAMLPVPGSEMAIRLLPRMIGPGRVGILASPSVLLYGTGGLAVGETKIGNQFICATCAPP